MFCLEAPISFNRLFMKGKFGIYFEKVDVLIRNKCLYLKLYDSCYVYKLCEQEYTWSIQLKIMHLDDEWGHNWGSYELRGQINLIPISGGWGQIVQS